MALVGGFAALFGLQCTIDISVNLTATVTGPIEPALHLSGDFVGHFGINPVTVSAVCPQGAATNINEIVGLPLAPGSGTVTLPFTGSIYEPAPPG